MSYAEQREDDLIEELTEAQNEIKFLRQHLQMISDQYGNQDLNHVDFRLKAKECADHALKYGGNADG